MLDARVAVTVQAPDDDALNTPPVMAQPAVPTVVTTKEYVPVPEPPVATREKSVLYTPATDVNCTADCDA